MGAPAAEQRGRIGEQLLAVAAQVFAEKGFHAASMRDIAQRLNCTPAALYYHARSKEEILFRIALQAFRSVLAPLETASFRTLAPPERLRFVIHNHLLHFASDLNRMKVLAHDSDYLQGEHYFTIQNLKRQYVHLVEDLLRELHPHGASLPQETLRWAALSLFGMMNWIYTWFRKDDLDRIGLYAEHVYFIFLDGLFRIDQNHNRFRDRLPPEQAALRSASTIEPFTGGME